MGEAKLRQLLTDRKANYAYLKLQLARVAEKHGERVLTVDSNRISMACSLTNLDETVFKPNGITATYFGSYLFSRRVSGVRVISASAEGQK